MFCPNCGKEANSNFCQYCGEKLAEVTSTALEPTASQKLNLDDINVKFNGGKIAMCKYVKNTTGCSLSEAKAIVDDYFLNSKPTQKSFWAEAVEQGNAANAKKALEKQEAKDRIKQMDKEGEAYCPKCHSTSLSADKKGFGIGKAVVGGFVAGPIGLIAGNAGAKKIRVTCLKCGYQFWAGKK